MPNGHQRPAKRFDAEEVRARAAAFHEVYYYNRLWEQAHWFGVPAWKCPLDLWIIQEIIAETKPDVIIECGTALGGSAMYFASLCRLAGKGRIISIDVKDPTGLPTDALVEYVQASSIDRDTLERVRAMIAPNERVMLVLDSLHNEAHVRAELDLWGGIVSPGCYCVVEDTNINGHPVYTDYEPDAGPGAFEAVESYLETTDRFVRDPRREKLLLTFNPGGFLRCVAEAPAILGTRNPDAPQAFSHHVQSQATTDRLRAEMDSAKRLAVERYETIRSLSAALAETVARAARERDARAAASVQSQADHAIWLRRQIESGEQRYDAMRRDQQHALARVMEQVRDLTQTRAALTQLLDSRAARLKAIMHERDTLLTQRQELQAHTRDLSALLTMARTKAAQLEGELMDASRAKDDMQRRLQQMEVDVETLLIRVRHLEDLEEARRQTPAVKPASTIWPRRAKNAPAAKA